eukprot:TRINITY_DN2709_c0_g1_i1.p1 TRINITY_DN2709_c0_g1~~TRINITY_DN2709_c0_g1_i1.p1  ORF type:complete len:195 (-),score=33.35 TRINITY_DN2709_c0_g1_i1:12-596(-)
MKIFAFTFFFCAGLSAMDVPSFGQRFSTFVSIVGEPQESYFWHFDLKAQKERSDSEYQNDNDQTFNWTTLSDYNANKYYQLDSLNGKTVDCPDVTALNQEMEEFAFSSGLLTFYNGTTVLNGTECNQWNTYDVFGSLTDSWWITTSEPYMPVRHYIAPEFDAPDFDEWYLNFCYDCFDNSVFSINPIPSNCTSF